MDVETGGMRLLTVLLAAVLIGPVSVPGPSLEAQRVTIVRDDWGIAHVHGKTDADAVFGMAYAQAEDDFNRVETNYLIALGRTAEADGELAMYRDLRQRLWVDPVDLQVRYRRSPVWLRSLMNAWAGGLNYYLQTHPAVHPRTITHFDPWMALSFTEGSIGGDIERVSLDDLRAFYGGAGVAVRLPMENVDAPIPDSQGSNGVAIAPANTVDHHTLLLINPHTSFYFRSELQMSSDEGLDAYGAVTWGQFFIYQGFNPHIGWMHTSTGADVVDEFAETIVHKNSRLYYKYGNALLPVTVSTVAIRYRTAGGMATRTFTVFHTHHGPIVRAENGKWIAEALMYRPIRALEQSYLRTKATDFASYKRISALEANSSNNTVFADDKGEIAYMHPQFIPRRDNRFDYTKPVDGANPATDWHGVLRLDEEPHIVNPADGWVFNTNDWPYSAAGPDSPNQSAFPRYMDTAGENERGIHIQMLLEGRHDFTLYRLLRAAFDPDLPLFSTLIPPLVRAYDNTPSNDPLKAKLRDPIDTLRTWNYHWSSDSVATSLAIFWVNRLAKQSESIKREVLLATPDRDKLESLGYAVDRLNSDFGTWQTPWGKINRFQRLDDNIKPSFDDTKPSIPVPFVAGTWGSLAAFYAGPAPNTKRWYGQAGNSFVAVVEFGKRVHAVAVTAGGESGHPSSSHFDDEAERYAGGDLREVYFYPNQLRGHIERTYHPGE